MALAAAFMLFSPRFSKQHFVIEYCYLPYVRALQRAIEQVWMIMPSYSDGLQNNFVRQHAAIILQAEQVDFVQALDSAVSPELVKLEQDYSLLLTEQVIRQEVGADV